VNRLILDNPVCYAVNIKTYRKDFNMKLKTEQFRAICSDILCAVDTSPLSEIADNLQIEAEGNILKLSVTNKEYFVSTSITVEGNFDSFFATVNATQFLRLVSKLTAEYIDFSIVDGALVVKSNGEYKFPLIYEGNEILRLPKISLSNVTSSFTLNSDVLLSVMKYNGKELLKVDNNIAKKQMLYRIYYLDDNGAITLSGGACVNEFHLDSPVQIILTDKIIKLFKLFGSGVDIRFELSTDIVLGEFPQTRVRFSSKTVEIEAILPSLDKLFKSIPVAMVRETASVALPYSALINKDALLQAINRLFLFVDNTVVSPIGLFEFYNDHMCIYNSNMVNNEVLYYDNEVTGLPAEGYKCKLNLADLKITAENCEGHVMLNFGGEKHVLITTAPSVVNIIPIAK